jgi:Uma2 family endonuclease
MQIEAKAQPDALVKQWREILADSELARWPGRIETDRYGRIVMSPPPSLTHGSRQSKIAVRLTELLPDGQVVTECPLVTADGVKGIDIAWLAPGRTELFRGDVVLTRAPEICVEVLSPSNSPAEMAEKRALYFEAGAVEVWLCALDGELEFYCAQALSASSGLCPGFPLVI